MNGNKTDNWERLRAHLHRGGEFWYLWVLETKLSHWYRTSEIPKPIGGKVNVYFGVHPTARAKDKPQRATNADVCAVNCLFADMDAKAFGNKPRALEHVERLTPAPSVVVDSGGGYHCYWLLADPFIIQTDADRERARRAQAAWVALVGGDNGAKDLARVLRVPGTFNHKYSPPRPVEFVRVEFDHVYSLDELERAALIYEVDVENPDFRYALENEKFGAGRTFRMNQTTGRTTVLMTPEERDRARLPSDNSATKSKYAQAALAGELDKLARTPEGGRNNQLNASAFALGQLVGAGVLERGDVEARLADAARAIGLTERETRATIRSGIEAGMREPRAIPDGGGNGHGGTSPRGDASSTPDVVKQAGQYVVKDGRICRIKRTQEGEVVVPLCNFVARIVAEVARDDGDDVRRVLTIEGMDAEGKTLPPAQVDAVQFASMRWVTAQWGARAIVEAGTSAQDHLRAAIQYLSPNITSRHVFAHTGWRVINGKRVYLTQGGALGGDGIAVELDRELERYRLPTQPRDVLDAMRESLRFLEIAPMRVTVPLWAAMYLAPLAEIIPLRFMLWLYGVTGAFKSSLAAVALSHYGDFTQDDLIQWSGTANSLEKYPFLAKDAPLVFDDYAPQNDPTSAQRLEQLAARLVRDVGNHGGRSRLKSDLTLRTIYRPRGLVISTGEHLPYGQSLVARLVTIEFNKGDVDVARLTEAQDACAAYPDAMAGYILWLAPQWDDLQANLPKQWRDLRARARKEGQHARLPESIASLYAGFDLGLTFAVEIGALTLERAEQLRAEGWAALCGIAERQHALTEEQRPTRRFLTVIAELVSQGKARLNHVDTPDASGDGELLGWHDDDFIYLLPSAAYHCVARYERDEGRIFGVKESTLRKMLAEEGLSSVSGDTHLAVLVRIGGKQKRVLRILKRDVEAISGVSLA